MRPTILHVGGTLYWTIQTYDPDQPGLLKDADSTPSVAVRKNGASSADSVTITKRSATTGLYDCSYNPAAEVEGDTFQFEESAAVTGTTTSSATYTNQFSVRAVHAGAVELDSSSVNAVADQVWDEATSGHTTSGTYGGRIVRSTNNNVEVQITGSNHIAADVHQVQANGLTASTEITAINTFATRLTTAIVLDGAVWQFTTNALENAPSEAGPTDWTANERAAIRAILGIPASGTTPTDPTMGILDNIRDLVAVYIAGIAASASLTPGTIVGFPATLNVGDSYTDDCDSAIHVFIRDENDDPIAAVGTHDFTDGDFAPECIITQNGNTGRVKCEVEYVVASPENYLKIQIPSKESRRATPGIATVQVLLKWDGAQKALSKQTVTWEALI